ncbi:MAG: hypothetical protein ACK476_00460 [Fluviicola sp.]
MRFLLFIVLIFNLQVIYSQSEIRMYVGLGDYPGLSFEHRFKNNLAFETGTSFRSKKNGNFHGLQVREKNLFVNGIVKKYHTNKKGNTNFFYGAYLRYWQQYNYAIDALKQPYPTSLQALLDQNLLVTYGTKTHKISLGLITGFTFPIAEKFTFGINMGLGWSLRSTYWEKVFLYNEPDIVYQVHDNEFIGYFNHLSIVGNISFGYRFGISKTEKPISE